MKLCCLRGSNLALDLTERKLRQPLIPIFTFMRIWEHTHAIWADHCPQMIKTLLLKLMKQKGICL